MHQQASPRLPEISRTGAQERLLKLELERESGRQTACLLFVHTSKYAALSSRPESVLHPEELKYFHSLSALKRKKDYLLGRYAAKRALLSLSPTPSAPEIHIRPGVFQQPVVIGPGCEELSACITHSGAFAAAIAFPTGHPLGIDIEWHDNAVLETLKQHVETHELPPTELCTSEAERYIRVWTVKESLSKILQCGLTTPFSVLKLRADPIPNRRAWSGEFENFSQYRFISLSSPKLSFALVHPRRTKVVLPLEQIINFTS
jgi:phosphopantetheinyl transferase